MMFKQRYQNGTETETRTFVSAVFALLCLRAILVAPFKHHGLCAPCISVKLSSHRCYERVTILAILVQLDMSVACLREATHPVFARSDFGLGWEHTFFFPSF